MMAFTAFHICLCCFFLKKNMNETLFTQEEKTSASPACLKITVYIINVQVSDAILYNNISLKLVSVE